jgi:DNA damage-inducible protein 1
MLLLLICGDNTHQIELDENEDMSTLYQMVSAETNLPLENLSVKRVDVEVTGRIGTTLIANGLKNNDILTVTRQQPTSAAPRISMYDIRGDILPQDLLALCAEHPHLVQQFTSADPELGAMLAMNDVAKLRNFQMVRAMGMHKVKHERRQAELAIFADPDNEENQKKIAEKIRLESVQANMELAMEEMPEAFGSVVMLYIETEINGKPIKAFVDSGAQMTIMTARMAENLNLMRLLDTRYHGEARGVGTAKILGKIHMTQMKCGSSFFPVSVTVMENSDVDFLLGLDMLRRHRCLIDLSENCLRMEGSAGIESVPFLPEHEIPKKNRENSLPPVPPPSAGESKSSVDDSAAAQNTTTDGNCASSSESGGGVAELVAMGFSEEEAQRALQACDNNLQQAANLLSSSR